MCCVGVAARRTPAGGTGNGGLFCTDGGPALLLLSEELDELDDEAEDEELEAEDEDELTLELELLLASDEVEDGAGLASLACAVGGWEDETVESIILLRFPSPPPSRLPEGLRLRVPSSCFELPARSLTLVNQLRSTFSTSLVD